MILNEIPLSPSSADQTLDVTLDNVPYTLRVLWNERGGYFSLTVSYRDGEAILTNIKMVNNFPLVKRFQRLEMAGELYFLHKGGQRCSAEPFWSNSISPTARLNILIRA